MHTASECRFTSPVMAALYADTKKRAGFTVTIATDKSHPYPYRVQWVRP